MIEGDAIAFIYDCDLRAPGRGHHDARASVESICSAFFIAGDGVVPSGFHGVRSGLIRRILSISGRYILSFRASIILNCRRCHCAFRLCILLFPGIYEEEDYNDSDAGACDQSNLGRRKFVVSAGGIHSLRSFNSSRTSCSFR